MRNLNRSKILLLAACVGSASLPASAGDGGRGAVLSREMAAFLSQLDTKQHETTAYAFDDDERFDLRLAPFGLEGLRLDAMSDPQWKGLETALATVLSPGGLAKMNTIRSLEREVAEIEGGWFGFLFDRIRSARRYFLAVFGEPRADQAWGLRFDGHHLSLNWTAVPGKPVSVTPLFLGGQPRVVPDGLERAGLRVLVDEEDRAVELVNGLGAEQRGLARLPWGGGSAIRRPMFVSGGVPLSAPVPAGLPRSALDAESAKRLDDVIEVALANFVPEIAGRWRARVAAQSESVHFAYAVAGDDSVAAAGASLYYRIQGRDFLLEYDNSSEQADHIHVVLRDLGGDFGRDLLADHLAAHHSGRPAH